MDNFPSYIAYALKQLKMAVNRDNSNLTRDDHDAIEIKIDQLEQFIRMRYAMHSMRSK